MRDDCGLCGFRRSLRTAISCTATSLTDDASVHDYIVESFVFSSFSLLASSVAVSDNAIFSVFYIVFMPLPLTGDFAGRPSVSAS